MSKTFEKLNKGIIELIVTKSKTLQNFIFYFNNKDTVYTRNLYIF